jgi:hypothetical protein
MAGDEDGGNLIKTSADGTASGRRTKIKRCAKCLGSCRTKQTGTTFVIRGERIDREDSLLEEENLIRASQVTKTLTHEKNLFESVATDRAGIQTKVCNWSCMNSSINIKTTVGERYMLPK